MAWVVFTTQRMCYEDEPTDLLLFLQTHAAPDTRTRSSMFGVPVLAAWAIDHPRMRLW